MAEEALARIAEACKLECYRSSRAIIFPGGAIAHFEEFLTHVRMFWTFLSEAQARRMARAYGVMLHEMLGQVRNEADMGRSFGAGFTEIEAQWMREHEWAQTPERSEEHTSELQSLMRISYAVFCLKKKT